MQEAALSRNLKNPLALIGAHRSRCLYAHAETRPSKCVRAVLPLCQRGTDFPEWDPMLRCGDTWDAYKLRACRVSTVVVRTVHSDIGQVKPVLHQNEREPLEE